MNRTCFHYLVGLIPRSTCVWLKLMSTSLGKSEFSVLGLGDSADDTKNTCYEQLNRFGLLGLFYWSTKKPPDIWYSWKVLEAHNIESLYMLGNLL